MYKIVNHVTPFSFITSIMLVLLMVMLPLSSSKAEVYKTNEAFIQENFNGAPPQPKFIWLKDDLKKHVEEILAHRYGKLRVKYWAKSGKSLWILEEIGKEKPITTGIVVNHDKIEKVEILAFRESRGWEVKYPFFLKQFFQAGLRTDTQLNKNIDGITGATLSVRAVRKLSIIALYLHKKIKSK